MKPRIIFRTHYQADEPRLFLAAVLCCTSAEKSKSDEAVASTLEAWARQNDYTISTPGAVYAVGNTKQLGLLTQNNLWSPSGVAIAFFNKTSPVASGQRSRQLSPLEERLYSVLYLQASGAMLISFGKWLLGRTGTGGKELRDESVFETLTKQILDEYLSLTTDVRERTQIRHERDRLGRIEYASSTKRHKRYPLLRTMQRLRLIEVRPEDLEVIEPDKGGRLKSLVERIPNIQVLERTIREGNLRLLLDEIWNEEQRNDLPDGGSAKKTLAKAYEFALSLGLQGCSLSYLDNVIQSFFPRSPQSAEQLLSAVHSAYPGEVRFHVDRRGKRAFVLLSKGALADLAAS